MQPTAGQATPHGDTSWRSRQPRRQCRRGGPAVLKRSTAPLTMSAAPRPARRRESCHGWACAASPRGGGPRNAALLLLRAAAAAGCCWQSRRDRRPNGRRDAIGTSLTTVQHRKPPSARLRKAAVTRTSHRASPLRRMPVVSVNSTAAVAWRISESVKSHGRWHETTCTTTAPEHKTSKWHRKNLN